MIMCPVNTDDFIEIARDMCEKAGSRLTETRLHMLEVLLDVKTPMSAYELTDHYNTLIFAIIHLALVKNIRPFL